MQLLIYYHKAIADFTKAMTIELYDANIYFGRATSKRSIYDIEGSIEDLKMAISLAKIPSNENVKLNEKAKSI
ncbi:hypothetical protein [Parafilimonas sp.]|uniref:hypothetical protein n=1 Tax=Parafilimonas sp. TaxID=1969739 RepID=UPI0039E21D29